jgi:hypothetical protein
MQAYCRFDYMLACEAAELVASFKGRELYQVVFSMADLANAWTIYTLLESGADYI